MIVWFDPADAARRLFLPVAVRPGSRSVLVRPGNGGIDAHVPGDQTVCVGLLLQRGQDPCPGAIALPSPVPSVHGAPVPVAVRHVPPWRAGAYPPPDSVDELPFAPLRRPAWFLRCG